MRKTIVLSWAAAAVLAACGGSNDPGPDPAGTCQKAPIPTTGPGDTSNYFPATVGLSWTYSQSSGGTATMTVTGTQTVGGETASVFTSSSSVDPTPVQELLAKRPAGVVVLADAAADPVEQQLYPELILPFPVAVAPQSETIRCTSLPVGDLDGDGKTDHADIVEYLTVLSTTETATVPAGSFVNVADVRRDLQMTVHGSAGSSATLTMLMQDWYAPGVGLVAKLVTVSVPGYSESVTSSLTSWSGLGKPYAAPAARAAPAPVRTAPGSLTAGAVRLARQLAGLGR